MTSQVQSVHSIDDELPAERSPAFSGPSVRLGGVRSQRPHLLLPKLRHRPPSRSSAAVRAAPRGAAGQAPPRCALLSARLLGLLQQLRKLLLQTHRATRILCQATQPAAGSDACKAAFQAMQPAAERRLAATGACVSALTREISPSPSVSRTSIDLTICSGVSPSPSRFMACTHAHRVSPRMEEVQRQRWQTRKA